MIRGVIERPEFELAGVRVFDPAKVGVDAGTLVGRPPAGVIATDDPYEILALDADCVIYAPIISQAIGGDLRKDLQTVCELLSSGKNVISLAGMLYPYARGPEFTSELERACKTGETSVFGTGVNPGFTTEVLPLVLSGVCRRVDHIYVRECADFSGHPSRLLIHEMGGLGKSEEEYLKALPTYRGAMRDLFTESLQLVGAGLGVTLDHVDVSHEYLLADEDFEIQAVPIPRGTVAAGRWTFSGMVGGRPLVTIECVHKSDARRVTAWESPGYAVRVHGRPSVTLTADEDWVSNGITAAAAFAVNAVPAVCEAAPGIRTFLDLPVLTGRAAGV
ncbi:dihydrodipicolinate reductase [Actinomadura sp. HBU206391]|uniref:NAD(P)H-dependent amine dehydrogenase family protein n=1 Tax=Actinomadura sp. HBU206391 TaxID=2731692 RepID=UPI002905DC9E|nr:dihydrodipicolinate reductase [Actinomadura sp. HBU206391]